MHKIITKKEIAPAVKLFEIKAPLVAKKARAGQFVILRIDENGERIPLTIANFDAQRGSITIIFHEVGKTTKQLGGLNEGDNIADIVGPLGNAMVSKKYGTVVCIGGGVGIAPIYLKIKAFKRAGNEVISIIGARTKELLILEEGIRKTSDELYIATDDGSKGHHGFVTDVLQELIDTKKNIDLVLAVGPVVMMRAVGNVTKRYGIKTVVSLNPIMIDGTGMCGACRVTIDGKSRFACVDGPEFDAHLVDFEELMNRQRIYLDEEDVALQKFGEHKCH